MVKRKNQSVRTRVTTVTCPVCKIEFYSRARHDCRLCRCSNQTMVDGGFEYLRVGGVDIANIKTRARYIKASREELYNDWRTGTNEWGVIYGR
jgi:hypothetical protein